MFKNLKWFIVLLLLSGLESGATFSVPDRPPEIPSRTISSPTSRPTFAHFALFVVSSSSDPSGSVEAEYEYSPFGKLTSSSGAMADENPFRFSTKYWDTETGLGYWGMRYYHPEQGRWLSRDPLGEEGGLLLYGFVGNDPVGGVDLLGMWDWDADIIEWGVGSLVGAKGPENRRAAVRGAVEGLESNPILKVAYTGGVNVRKKVMDAALDSVAADLYGGLRYEALFGFNEGDSGRPRMAFSEHLRIWNPETGAYDFSWVFDARADAIGHHDVNSDIGVLGYSMGAHVVASPELDRKFSIGGGADVHFQKVSARSNRRTFCGADFVRSGQSTIFGAEASFDATLDLKNKYLALSRGYSAQVLKNESAVDMIIDENRALRAKGEVILGGSARKREVGLRLGLPLYHLGATEAKIIGGGLFFGYIDRENVGEL